VMTPARLAGLAAAREKLRGACPRATSRLQDRAEAGTLLLDTSAGSEAKRMPEIAPMMPREVAEES